MSDAVQSVNAADVSPSAVLESRLPTEAEKQAVQEAKVVSPAQDLRDIQALLANGIYPGNFAPQIQKSYALLEKLALEVENNAKTKQA